MLTRSAAKLAGDLGRSVGPIVPWRTGLKTTTRLVFKMTQSEEIQLVILDEALAKNYIVQPD